LDPTERIKNDECAVAENDARDATTKDLVVVAVSVNGSI